MLTQFVRKFITSICTSVLANGNGCAHVLHMCAN
nr:MAG TPA: hypothetical protein [Caudoviricetes sp.]